MSLDFLLILGVYCNKSSMVNCSFVPLKEWCVQKDYTSNFSRFFFTMRNLKEIREGALGQFLPQLERALMK